MTQAAAGAQPSAARKLPSILSFFGVAALAMACIALGRGYMHADEHHHVMSSRHGEKERMKEEFMSLGGTLSSLRRFEEKVVTVIEDKIHGISESISAAHENPILDVPHAKHPEEGAAAADPGTVADNLDEDPISPRLGSGAGHADGHQPEQENDEEEDEGEEDEGEEDEDATEHEVASQMKAGDLDSMLEAALQGEDPLEGGAESEEGLGEGAGEEPGDGKVGGEADQGGDEEGLSPEQEGSPQSANGTAAQAQGNPGAPAAGGRSKRSRAHRGKARHAAHQPHAHPLDRPGPDVRSKALTKIYAAAHGAATHQEPSAASAAEPPPAAAALPAAARRRGGRGRSRHCGGHCILNQLRQQKEKADKAWITDPDGNFHTDETVASDDTSSCMGKCGKHGFCRLGKCVCVVLYEGDRCQTPKKVGSELNSKFDGSYLFNAKRLKPHLGQHITYTCNPKKGTSKTHSASFKVSEDLMKVLPDDDPMAERLYAKCAVVGNSGVLASYKFGKAIDSHDAVFRFNVGPTISYEERVGSKTTFRLVNTNHAGWHEKKEADIQQLQSMIGLLLYVKYRKAHPNAKLFAFDPDFSTYVSSNLKVLPTGGYFAIWMALQRCTEVFVYGFHFEPGFRIQHHYFNSEKPLKGGKAIHDYDAEYRRIKWLAKHNFLTLVEPCIAGCEKDTGIPCTNCPKGSACQCGTGNPMPVARAGFCRLQDSFSCFLKCQKPEDCSSQLETGAKANMPEGGCSASMMQAYREGQLQCQDAAAGVR